MTLYDLCNNISLQGNIEVKVFDLAGNELETHLFMDEWQFQITYTHPELEDLYVSYIYATRGRNGTIWTTIEITKEDEE